MEVINLKPRPFCGKEITQYSVEYLGSKAQKLEAKCRDCNAKISIDREVIVVAGYRIANPDDAIAIWNTRRTIDDKHEN